MRKWMNLFEDAWLDDMLDDFDWDKLFRDIEVKTRILPAGTELFHGTEGDWNPEEIRGPAWFGDYKMAYDYVKAVFNHTNPTIHRYITTQPYRLLLIEGEIARRILGIMDGGEILMRDLALTVIENGFDGWFEPHGEIMIGDPSTLKVS